MNSRDAQRFSDDIRKELDENSFVDNIYMSVKHVGTKVFRNCKCDQIDGWIFIWTQTETYTVKESDMGDFVIIDTNMSIPCI